MKIDTSTLESELNKLARDLEQGSEKALRKIAEYALEEKQKEIDKTYSRPIPVSKNGKPKWNRTGKLRDNQKIVKTSNTSFEIRGVDYEVYLAELKTDRKNEAAETAQRKLEQRANELFEDELKKALNL